MCRMPENELLVLVTFRDLTQTLTLTHTYLAISMKLMLTGSSIDT